MVTPSCLLTPRGEPRPSAGSPAADERPATEDFTPPGPPGETTRHREQDNTMWHTLSADDCDHERAGWSGKMRCRTCGQTQG
ncbi:hypothetical protein GCM10023082_19420 [Streptomyces tremellae]|uniref:Uncharacterized protein n=1 Tax=Streptomyces tremellae TaxID=1124239 RepID=A0ABP7ENA1_9ACTN